MLDKHLRLILCETCTSMTSTSSSSLVGPTQARLLAGPASYFRLVQALIPPVTTLSS
ncbi:hypothetical protein RHMOL_Rhmol04G0256500 [Rhododendron molle]|uniref:Uncharacterized protein n=1 Tax=Rhododendron molle TaxID=49168 RepID=A0ACC0P6T8_RHOML|nr:hypothetical protein RHMOL_Rhmol04G0256500 [Rhododendron molle]